MSIRLIGALCAAASLKRGDIIIRLSGKELTPTMQSFRQAWLDSKSK